MCFFLSFFFVICSLLCLLNAVSMWVSFFGHMKSCQHKLCLGCFVLSRLMYLLLTRPCYLWSYLLSAPKTVLLLFSCLRWTDGRAQLFRLTSSWCPWVAGSSGTGGEQLGSYSCLGSGGFTVGLEHSSVLLPLKWVPLCFGHIRISLARLWRRTLTPVQSEWWWGGSSLVIVSSQTGGEQDFIAYKITTRGPRRH